MTLRLILNLTQYEIATSPSTGWSESLITPGFWAEMAIAISAQKPGLFRRGRVPIHLQPLRPHYKSLSTNLGRKEF